MEGDKKMKIILGLLCLGIVGSGASAQLQTKQDEDVLRGLPQRFQVGFNRHDAHQLAQMMAEDVEFVTVGLTWLRGRADFEKYHARLLTGRFHEIAWTVLDTDLQFIRPEVAVVRHSWTAEGDRNPDGSVRPQRFGLMTMVVEKRNGTWLVVAVQNVNAPTSGTRPAEAQDIKSPIVVPIGK
jgi:uncharacterized protein (TIGR02246 family)